MQNQDVTPASENVQEGAPAGGGTVADGLPQLPTQEQIESALGETPGAADQGNHEEGEEGGTPPETPPEGTPPAEQTDDDPDGDRSFENEFKNFKAPEGILKRITKLTEQRNSARETLKGFEGLKEYNTDEGRQYINMLAQFDSKLEDAIRANPWLADIIRDVVINGQQPDREKIQEALGGQAQEDDMGEEAGEAPMDPKDKTLMDLKAKVDAWEAEKQRASMEAARREAVDREKENYRAEISEFEGKNPQFKGDKRFIRIALQNSAARNISFTEAAKDLAEYMGGREATKLKDLAKVGNDREGAGVETPGRGGVPVKSRPAFGSDEERAQMLEQLGIKD